MTKFKTGNQYLKQLLLENPSKYRCLINNKELMDSVFNSLGIKYNSPVKGKNIGLKLFDNDKLLLYIKNICINNKINSLVNLKDSRNFNYLYEYLRRRKLSENFCNLMKWDYKKEMGFNFYIKLLSEYIKKYNKFPSFDCIYKKVKLYSWVSNQKIKYKNNKLTKKEIKLLENLKYWSWSNNDLLESNWLDNYNKLKLGKIDKFIKTWIGNQRLKYREDKLNQDKINLLEKIKDFSWVDRRDEIYENRWYSQHSFLLKYIKKYNKLPNEEHDLYNWCNVQKQNYKENKLSNERIKLLESISIWSWGFKDIWNKKYNLCVKFIKSHNKIPIVSDTIGNIKIGQWVSTQRRDYKNNKLDNNQIKLLEEIKNWKWEPINDYWVNNYKLLLEFVKINNKLPKKSESIKIVKIGIWCMRQRQKYNNPTENTGKLTPDQIKQLELIKGWKW